MTGSELSQREATEGVRDWATYLTSEGELITRNWANVEAGLIPWSDITDDELSRGKLYDKNGQFRGGGNSSVIPRKMVAALTRRLKERYDDKLREVLLEMQQVHIDVALDAGAPPGDRLRAAAYVQERLIGKVPDKVEVVAEVKPWEGLIDGILTEVEATE